MRDWRSIFYLKIKKVETKEIEIEFSYEQSYSISQNGVGMPIIIIIDIICTFVPLII